MAKTFKKQNGKLKKTETQTVESEYTRVQIVESLVNLAARRIDLDTRYAVSSSVLDAEEENYQELLAQADAHQVNE